MRLNQKGFSALEGLLIFIVIALLAGIGWYVWDQNKKEEQKQSAAPTTQNVEEQPAETLEPMVIKELGITIKPSSALKGLTYTIQKFDDGEALMFKTTEYTTKIKACNPDEPEQAGKDASFMSATRQVGTAPEETTIETGDTIKQFDGFWVSAGYPNGIPCADGKGSEAVNALEKKLQINLKEAIKEATVTKP
jgi:hypothetical protein